MAEPVSTTSMLLKAAPYVIAGMQMLGGIGSNVYGGKRIRRQQEENERATARAAMISALTGGSARPQPAIMESTGENVFNTLSNIGSIGLNVLPFIKAPRATVTSNTQTPSYNIRSDRVMQGIPNPIPQDFSGVGTGFRSYQGRD